MAICVKWWYNYPASQNMSVWRFTFAQLAYSLYIKLMFLGVGILKTPFIMLAELAVAPEDRPRLWRLACRRHAKFLLKIAGVKLSVPSELLETAARLPSAVYVANHPSMMDGFSIFTFLGPEIIPLTEPMDKLVFPVGLWFRRAGVVDVIRDDYDAAHSKTGTSKKDALARLASSLDAYTSVLIFPEGHLERMHKLHYIHTGAARVAIAARAPVVVLGLVNMDRVYMDKNKSRPGGVQVRFAGPLLPPSPTRAYSHRRAVRDFSNTIADSIRSLLPARNLPPYLDEPRPQTIGAFFDIDNTLYQGYSQQDFVRYLMRHRHISRFLWVSVFWNVLLEKLHFISHRTLMERVLGFIRGWKKEDVERLAAQFFDDSVLGKLQRYTLPILKDHQEQGHTIVLITEIIEPLAKQFREYFKASALVSTRLETHGGAYTGRIIRLCKGKEKARAVRRLSARAGIDLKKSFAYGDSFSDVSMLQLVKHKVAVCPQKQLRNFALHHNWNILH